AGAAFHPPVVVVEADDQSEPGGLGGLEHVHGRKAVDADGVQPGLGDGGEILAHPIGRGKSLAVVAAPEAAVSHAADAERPAAETEELTLDTHPRVCEGL